MENFYYFTGLYILWIELLWVINPKTELKKVDKLKEITKKEADTLTREELFKVLGYIPKYFIIFFLFIGLFTFQWTGYLVYMVFLFGFMMPFQKLIQKYYNIRLFVCWIDSLICVLFVLFVIINHFHLRIDLFELFKTWIY